jgi:hypothetical protein
MCAQGEDERSWKDIGILLLKVGLHNSLKTSMHGINETGRQFRDRRARGEMSRRSSKLSQSRQDEMTNRRHFSVRV